MGLSIFTLRNQLTRVIFSTFVICLCYFGNNNKYWGHNTERLYIVELYSRDLEGFGIWSGSDIIRYRFQPSLKISSDQIPGIWSCLKVIGLKHQRQRKWPPFQNFLSLARMSGKLATCQISNITPNNICKMMKRWIYIWKRYTSS